MPLFYFRRRHAPSSDSGTPREFDDLDLALAEGNRIARRMLRRHGTHLAERHDCLDIQNERRSVVARVMFEDVSMLQRAT